MLSASVGQGLLSQLCSCPLSAFHFQLKYSFMQCILLMFSPPTKVFVLFDTEFHYVALAALEL